MKTLHVISVSGGKDSTALYLWGLNNLDSFRAVFADTGNEHPVTLNYVRNLPDLAGGPAVEWVKADFEDYLWNKGQIPSGNPFLDMCVAKKRAPSARAQFCTENLKMAPIRKWLASARKGYDKVIMYTGIRKGESLRRSRYQEWEYLPYYDCETRRPLLEWSETDIFDYMASFGVEPNPLYKEGFTRVGCFPCIHARKSELARLPDWAWDKIQDWENKIGRSWFAPKTCPNASSKFGEGVPDVPQVRAWSKTKHGGKEVDPDAPAAADVPACMSTWGICE